MLTEMPRVSRYGHCEKNSRARRMLGKLAALFGRPTSTAPAPVDRTAVRISSYRGAQVAKGVAAEKRPVLAGSTSLAASSTDTKLGALLTIAVTWVWPGGRTRLYSVPLRMLTAICDSTVSRSASHAFAPEIARLLAGRLTSLRS